MVKTDVFSGFLGAGKTTLIQKLIQDVYKNEKTVIIENEFGITIFNIEVLGQGLDSIAYRVNDEYIFRQSKYDEVRINLRKEVQVLNYLKGKITLKIPEIKYYNEK